MCKSLLSLITASLLVSTAWCAKVSLDLRSGANNSPAVMSMAYSSPSSAPATPNDGVLQRQRLPAGSARVAALQVGDELSLQLFDNASVELVLTAQCESPLGGRSFLAKASGADGVMNAVVHETGDGLQIDVQDYRNGKVYTVASDDGGVVVKEIDTTVGKVVPTAPRYPELPEEPRSATVRSLAATAQQSSTCVDILVAFDRNAAAWADAQGGGITNFATVTVQKMNLALGNTGLDASFRFRLVGVMAVAAESDDLDATLDAVTQGDGDWAGVKAMRDAVGADLVTTLIDTGSAYGTTGLGWGLRTTSVASFSEHGYNVCSVRAAAQSHVVTHECGHNMGAGHSDQQADSPGPQLYSYSSGHYFNVGSTSYHTIMAYGSDGYTDTTYLPVPFFSSPSHQYEGVTVGNDTHDNTKTIQQTFADVAKWRNQVVPESYDVFFTPESGASFKDSISVTLSPGKENVEIRYTTDGTEPTASSTRYAGAFTLTETSTVKARTVISGALGPVFQATYYKEDLGMALNAPQYAWTTGSDCPWEFQTTNTCDGVHALGACVPSGGTAWVKATVVGPLSGEFSYMYDGYGDLSVTCDGATLFSEDYSYSYGYYSDYVQATFDVPEGTHELVFSLSSGSDGPTFGWLDDFKFYSTARPTFSPKAGEGDAKAHEFTGQMLVTIQHALKDAKIYYTTDGSDPGDEGSIHYEGPFPITESTTVRAIAVAAGGERSGVATGDFIERHTPRPGEWTTNVSGALEAAKTDGRLIAVVCANYTECYYTQLLEPIARGDAFTAWAAANGIYLVSADTGREPGASDASTKFWSLYRQTSLRTALNGYAYYPTFVMATPDANTTCVGAFVARTGWASNNGAAYDYGGTSDSLVSCISAALGETPPGAPVLSMSSATSYPRTVTLQNTNGTGVVYYTLDGSAPTPSNGIRYTSAITVSTPGGRLQAAVWPSSGTSVSSPVVVQDFRTVADFFNTDAVTWQNDASLPWTEQSAGIMQGGKNPSLTSGTSTSTLRAKVNGSGKLVFDYGIASRGQSKLTLKVNGTAVKTWYSYVSRASYVYDVTSSGETTFEFVYSCSSGDSPYSSYYGWIGNVKWVHQPTAPQETAASDGTYLDGVFVTWKEVPGALTYRLYRSESESFANPVLVRETEKTFGWDTTAAADKAYWYAVTAVNAFGESPRSALASGWHPAPLEIVDQSLPTAYESTAYSHRFTARGGKAPYTWQNLSLETMYDESGETSTFAATGIAKNWKYDDDARELALPFAFPFYGKTYSKAYVSSNGTISFDQSFSGYNESVEGLKQHAMIAAFWDDLTTADGDIYVTSASDSITVRWVGAAYSGGGAVNFAVTLKSDGTIRLQYGSGNSAKGMIGISAGDGKTYLMSTASQRGNMEKANDIIFEPAGLPDGFSLAADGTLSGTPTKTGAYKFRIGLTDAEGESVSAAYVLNVTEPSSGAVVPGSETGGKEIAVEGTWVSDELVKRFGSDRASRFVSLYGSDLATALLKKTGKKSADGEPMCVWQDYVAGTDPTDPESKFTAKITIENGVPNVTWVPDLNENETKSIRAYTTYGAKEPGGTWKDLSTVAPAEQKDYRFFKVTVEMP